MIISIWYFVSFILLYFVLLFTEVLSRDSARKLQQTTHHQIWIPQVRNLFSHSPLTKIMKNQKSGWRYSHKLVITRNFNILWWSIFMNAEKMFWNCKFSSKILTWRSFQSNVHMKWVAHMSNNISFISVRMNRNQIFAERKEAIPHIPFVSDTSYSSLKCVFSFFKRVGPSLRGSLIKR